MRRFENGENFSDKVNNILQNESFHFKKYYTPYTEWLHPSGNPTPSPEDIKVTGQLYEAGRLLDIQLLDHVIIGDNQYTSLRSLGLGFPKA